MPLYTTEGGGQVQPVVAFKSVSLTPLAGGAATETVKSGTVEQAVAQASVAVKQIQTAPAIANLPANAEPGQLYSFTSQPAVLYFLGADNIWRALVAVTVA